MEDLLETDDMDNDSPQDDRDLEELTNSGTVPARFVNAVRFYRYMERNSRQMYAKIVWEGSALALLRDMGLAPSYYQGIAGFLKESGSIILLKRGGGTAPSLWALDHEPTYEEYVRITSNAAMQETKEKESKDKFLRMANDIMNRLAAVETDLNLIKRAYMNMAEKGE